MGVNPKPRSLHLSLLVSSFPGFKAISLYEVWSNYLNGQPTLERVDIFCLSNKHKLSSSLVRILAGCEIRLEHYSP